MELQRVPVLKLHRPVSPLNRPFSEKKKLIDYLVKPNSLTNTHQTVLTGPQAIIAVVNNFDCSRSITTQQANLPVSDGYRVQLANPINISEVYTESELFEVRAQGSAYPDPSSTPTASSGSSGTGTGGSPTQTGGANGDTNSAGILSTGSVLTGVVALVAGVVGAL